VRETTRRLTPGYEILLAIAAFVVVHLLIAVLIRIGPNQPIGDVSILYRQWVSAGRASGSWAGIDSASVYPILALVPMIVAAAAGTAHIVGGWLILMAILDAVAAAFLWRFRAFGVRVVWWWLVFLLLLGPIGQARIDTVSTAVALIGVAFVTVRPAIAAALFTIGAWVKVWPAALVVALLARARHRRTVVGAAVLVTVVVVIVDAVLGGWRYVLSFVGEQAGRGLQVESLIATPFMWAAGAHVPGVSVYYDHTILAFQVSGPGTSAAAAVSTPLMIVLVLGAVVLAAVALHRGVPSQRVAPVVALLLVMAIIVANKVGSPQYVGWIAVPVIWGLVAGRPSARSFRTPALLVLPTALLTQLIYPFFYSQVLEARWEMIAVLTARNLLELGVLVWAVIALAELAALRGPAGSAVAEHVEGTA
jgi:hypothetical protein